MAITRGNGYGAAIAFTAPVYQSLHFTWFCYAFQLSPHKIDGTIGSTLNALRLSLRRHFHKIQEHRVDRVFDQLFHADEDSPLPEQTVEHERADEAGVK